MKDVSLKHMIVRNLKKTYKNKLIAIALIAIGVCAVVAENYTGMCTLATKVGLWLFFRTENLFD